MDRRQGFWLKAAGAFMAVALSLVAIAGSLLAARDGYRFWGSPLMIAAYVFGLLAFVCFASAVRNVPFPFRRVDADTEPLPAIMAGRHSLEELIGFLKKEQKSAAAWSFGGTDYRDVRAEMDAWAVVISRRLREYDQELARMFNEDDRRYTSLDTQAFLERRLQQLQQVIGVLERRRDVA